MMVTVQTVNPVRNLCGLLCVMPLNHHGTFTFILRIFNGLLVVAVTILSIVTYPTFLNSLQSFETTVKIVFTLTTVIVLFTTMYQMIKMNYKSSKEFISMVDSLEMLEKTLSVHKPQSKDKSYRFYVEIVLIHAILIAYFGFNIVRVLKTIPWYILHFMVSEYFRYRLCLCVLLIRNYTLIIGNQMDTICHILMSLDEDNTTGIRIYLGDTQQGHKVKLVFRAYNKITQVIASWNAVFGGFYVTMYMYLMAGLLSTLNLATIYGFGTGGNLPEDESNMLDVDVSLIIYSSLPVFIFYGMFDACETVAGKIDDVPSICYKFMSNFEEYKGDIFKDLKSIAQQVSVNEAKFSAAGFFDINYQMILPTVTMAISYLIVLIQFHD